MATSAPLKKILALLDRGTTEESIAAAVVLGALAPKEKAVVAALAGCLDRTENLPLALAAARALGRIGGPQALNALLPLLTADGELRETGALALAGCGKAAFAAVVRELETADFASRNVICRILARMHTPDALNALLAFFLDPNFEVVKMAGRAIRSEIPSMSPAERKAAARTTLAFLRSRAVRDSRAATNSTLIVLGSLADPGAVPALLDYTGPERFRSTRRHALGAVRRTLLLAGSVSTRVVETVFPYLDDPDFESVVEPSLAILDKADLPAAFDRELTRLTGARYPQVRQFAVRKLAGRETKASAQALLQVLDGKDEDLRRSAVRALKHSPRGPGLLLPRLLAEKDPDRAWSLVHLMKPNAASLAPAQRKALEKDALKLLDKGDRRAEALLHLYRHTDEDTYCRTFLARARKAKTARRYAEAERDLRIISHTPHFDDEARFLLGLMALLAAGKDPSPTASRRALDLFRHLGESTAFDLEARLRRESRTLGPDGLFAIGFGLVEGRGPTRSLGVKLLRKQVKQAPRTKLGRKAKAKLETEGLL